MTDFSFAPGDQVWAGDTLATFVRAISPSQVIIQVGLDPRTVDPVSLRKAAQ